MIRDIMQKNEKVNPNNDLLKKLKALIPNAFKKDGMVDADAIRYWAELAVGDKHLVVEERETFNFLGKDYARLLYALDTETVIVPDEENNQKNENKDSENLYLSGDNLEVLKHLRRSYEGQVKCIYIDPPYNTGSDDFVYNDSFDFNEKDLQEKLGIDEPERAQKILKMKKRGSRSHAAWLTFMYPRLKLARDLLRDDGVIFISIDDNEQANLKILCDEIFGEENLICSFIWKKRQMVDSRTKNGASKDHDYLLCFSRSDDVGIRGSYTDKTKYKNPDNDPRGDWMSADMTGLATAAQRPNLHYDLIDPETGKVYPCPPTGWRYERKRMNKFIQGGEILFPDDVAKRPRRKKFLKDVESEFTGISSVLDTVYSTQGTRELRELFDGRELFDFPKPVDYIKMVIEQGAFSPRDSIILDFFSGSGTTAHAIMQLNAEDGGNRKYIMVQIPAECPEQSEAFKAGYKTLDQIGMERIRRAAAKIQSEHPDAKCDFGFKHYSIEKPKEKTLDALEKFVPNPNFGADNILKVFGSKTVLATWMVDDGHTFNASVETIDLDGYTAYKVKDYLYLIDKDIGTKHMKALFQKYDEDKEFKPKHIVVFGYSFGITALETLKGNIKSVEGIDINLEIRY